MKKGVWGERNNMNGGIGRGFRYHGFGDDWVQKLEYTGKEYWGMFVSGRNHWYTITSLDDYGQIKNIQIRRLGYFEDRGFVNECSGAFVSTGFWLDMREIIEIVSFDGMIMDNREYPGIGDWGICRICALLMDIAVFLWVVGFYCNALF